MGLLGGLFDKKKRTNSVGEDLDHLTPEGELPWGWLSRNMPICKPYENQIVEIAKTLDSLKTDAKIIQLKKLIAIYYEYKKFCYSQNECYIKYFSDMWEHCHNSRCKDFEYITTFKAELKNLEDNYEELVLKDQRTDFIEKNILPTLRHDLMSAIKAEPGILQVTLFKRFDADLKPFIHTELYKLETEGLLIKEKDGRLNKLFLK